MGCLTICSVLVPLLAIVAPIAMILGMSLALYVMFFGVQECMLRFALRSAAFDGRFWDVFPAWDVKDMPDLSGKVAIITGPTAPRLE